ncbi:MAG: 2-oxo acid dehydrogenase subunit E2 [Planctomycetota bacterium]|nr:2-oxo acid dehydrogenase subunit E2 [Planctomycetota bacterium]MDA1213024.1 2-oxo acid dehydrogenase subunit E2 [Planctomycetota bacterium]
MAIQFKLPEISEGVESADVAEITVAVGDVIEAQHVVLEVETEKAVVEIRCPHAGKITEILVKQGQTIPIGEPLLSIEPAGAPAEKPAAPPQPAPAETPKESKPAPEPAPPKTTAAQTAPQPARTSAPPPATKTDDNGEKDQLPIPAGPATRRLARVLGVDLHQVTGSGPGGRVTQEDVQKFVKVVMTSGGGNAAAPAAGRSVPPLPDFSQFGAVERQKFSRLATTSANQLSLSWQMIPHVTQHDLADITELETARKKFMEASGKGGTKVTMTAAAVKAVVTMLKAFPQFNASYDSQSNELVLKHYYNIGVAVDTDAGLVVPVIRDADHKTILQIAEELASLAQKARDRKLDMKEMQGGSFTITNLGGIGGTYFTPIVNYPEVAILGMSRSRWQMEVINGQPTPRLMLPLSLSYDHRVINGADAARFISRLSVLMSDAFRFLIET